MTMSRLQKERTPHFYKSAVNLVQFMWHIYHSHVKFPDNYELYCPERNLKQAPDTNVGHISGT